MKIKLNRINVWFGTAAGKISIGLFIASILLILIGILLSFLEGRSTPYSVAISLVFGIATNIASIIVTVTFVQSQFDRQEEIKEKNEEIKKIKRFNRVFGSYLQKYYKYYYYVTVPIDKRDVIDYRKINTCFEFKDLKDLHSFTLYAGDGFNKSSIEHFFESENDVIVYSKRMIEEIDFKYHDDLLRVLCCFVDIAIQANIKNGILGNEKMFTTSKDGKRTKHTDTICQWIAEDDKYHWSDTVKMNKGGNVMGPYVVLFDLLKHEGNLLNQYQELICSL